MSKDTPVEELKFEVGEKVAGYKIVEKIDEGGFGQVFKVSRHGKDYAMKIENNAMEGGSAIKLEVSVFLALRKEHVFPYYLSGGKKARFQYLVLELLGDNLRVLKARSLKPNGFSELTWSRVAIQCLFALKTMHNNGFVHRDVKPNNFAVGLGHRCRFILAFDFGLARKFICPRSKTEKTTTKTTTAPSKEEVKEAKVSKESVNSVYDVGKVKKSSSTNTINVEVDTKTDKAEKKERTVDESEGELRFRLPRKHTDFRGTHQYASPNAHLLKELGRVDDVWSLMYMVAELFVDLPWSGDDTMPVDDQKDRYTVRDIYDRHKVFDTTQLQMLDHIETMLRWCDYYTHPDYQLVYQFFVSVLNKATPQPVSMVAPSKNSKIQKKSEPVRPVSVWALPYDWESMPEAAYSEAQTVSNSANKSVMGWRNPGEFFKLNSWSHLASPGRRSPAPSSNHPSSKQQSSTQPSVKKTEQKGSKKVISKRGKAKATPSKQPVKVSREDSQGDGCETPVVKSVIQKKVASFKKSREKL